MNLREIKIQLRNPESFKIEKKNMNSINVCGVKFLIENINFEMRSMFLVAKLKSLIVNSRRGKGYSHIILFQNSKRALKQFQLYKFFYKEKEVSFETFIDKIISEISSYYNRFDYSDYLSKRKIDMFFEFRKEISQKEKEILFKFLKINIEKYKNELENYFNS